MYDPNFLNQLAHEIARRLKPELQQPANGRITPRLLTVAQAAQFTGRSKSSINHLIHRRQLRVVRVGRRVHIDVKDLEEGFIEQNKV